MTQTPENSVRGFLSNFELFEKSLNGQSASQLHDVRKAALARFAELGFPTTHDEEWRFTSVAPIAQTHFTPALRNDIQDVNPADIERFTFIIPGANRLVFIDGHYSARLSMINLSYDGVTIGSLAEALKTNTMVVDRYLTRNAQFAESAFTALNTAFLYDGAFLNIPPGTVIRDPIHLLFISTGGGSERVSHPRNLIVAGENSQVSIIESYVGMRQDVYFTNVVTEMSIDRGAIVEHDTFQDESVRAFHIGTMYVHQGGASRFTSNAVSIGGALVRNNVNVVLDAEGCECTLNGLSMAAGTQHVDNHTLIDHAKPGCVSHELYKSILDGKARGVFNGKIFVRRDAQKTDAKQTNKTLLLSDEATIDTKPQLEIFADDVKCTHGATVGQLDEEQIFYLRSRGIPVETARDILTYAFASDVVNRIHVEPLREQLDEIIHRHLQQGRLTQES